MANVNQTKTKAVGVSKLDNGRYLATWRDQFSKKHRKQCPTYQQAVRVRKQGEVEAWDGSFDPASVRRGKNNITFDDLVKDRLEIAKGNTSFELEKWRINFWKKTFKDRRVNSITHQDINRVLIDLVESRKLKPSTRNQYFTTLRTIFSSAVRNGKMDRNPCSGIKKLKENNQGDRCLDISEERRLMLVMPEKSQLTMIVAINTGLRTSEQMSLRWDDIDFRNRQITIRETKAGETQYQPMNEKAYLAFKRLSEMPRHISGDVFYWINQFTGNEKTPNYYKLRYAWTNYCKLAGIDKCRWHDLRHSYASRMVINNVNIVVVSQLMRHSDIKITMRYVHLAPRTVKHGLDELDNWYDKLDNWQEIDIQEPSRGTSASIVNY